MLIGLFPFGHEKVQRLVDGVIDLPEGESFRRPMWSRMESSVSYNFGNSRGMRLLGD
jgi:hypothetical protein